MACWHWSNDNAFIVFVVFFGADSDYYSELAFEHPTMIGKYLVEAVQDVVAHIIMYVHSVIRIGGYTQHVCIHYTRMYLYACTQYACNV